MKAMPQTNTLGHFSALLLLLCLLVTSLASNAGLLDENIITPEIQSITLNHVADDLSHAEFSVAVFNPNPFKIPVRSLSGTLTINENKVADIDANSKHSLAANSEQTFTVPVDINTKNVMPIAQQILLSGKAQYSLKGYAMTPVGELPFEQQGELNQDTILLLFNQLMTSAK